MTSFWRRLSARTARVFVFVYLFAGLFASLHAHSEGVAAATGGKYAAVVVCAADAAGADSSDAADALTPHVDACDKNCAVCDYVAHLVSPAVAPTMDARAERIAGPVPAPAVRPSPYTRYRFCDRSASRAPPAAVVA